MGSAKDVYLLPDGMPAIDDSGGEEPYLTSTMCGRCFRSVCRPSKILTARVYRERHPPLAAGRRKNWAGGWARRTMAALCLWGLDSIEVWREPSNRCGEERQSGRRTFRARRICCAPRLALRRDRTTFLGYRTGIGVLTAFEGVNGLGPPHRPGFLVPLMAH